LPPLIKLATRLLIAAYLIAAVLWFISYTGFPIRSGGWDAAFVFAMVFSFGHVLITALLLLGTFAIGWQLFRIATARAGKNYFLFAFSAVSLMVASYYTYTLF